MEDMNKHSGLTKGEKKLAVKMAVVDIMFLSMIFTGIGFLIYCFIS